MELTERLVAFAAEQVTGSTTVTYQDNEIDLSPPWRRWKLRDAILETTGIDYMDYLDAEALGGAMRAKGFEVKPGSTWSAGRSSSSKMSFITVSALK